ncbi:MAG: thiamine phosphate synthase, partial [Paracoccaceae bacterium]
MIGLRDQLHLYLVTDTALCADFGLVETVQQAVAGGVTMVQLRAKDATTPERIEMALALKAALAGTGVPLVVNDDLDAAIKADCDGAHIGQGDMPAPQARAVLGAGKILGLSCETPETVRAADPNVVDYLGLGPVFGTTTKTDHEPPIGFEGLAQLV